MKKNRLLFPLLSLLLLGFAACSSDKHEQTDLTAGGHELQFQLELPTQVKSLSQAKLSYTEKNSQRSGSLSVDIDEHFRFVSQLKSGLYDFKFEAQAQTEEGSTTYTGYLQNQSIQQASKLQLQVYAFVEQADFVIEELFYRGTTYPGTQKSYIGDQYIKITNNSDEVLYADGLALAESEFTSSMKYNSLNPDIREQAVTIQALYAIPGTGKDHPVKPGESLIIADRAMNHQVGAEGEEGNPNSFDLSQADFEWYDETEGAGISDTDNPLVPNLDKIYSYTRTIWILSMQGNRSYLLVRLPQEVDKQKFLSEYKYEYSYRIPKVDRDLKKSSYQVPNAWVVDAVNLAAPDKDAWNIISPKLDAGRTFCGINSKDPAAFGTVVRRKVAYTNAHGRAVLQDTNNSSDDFEGTLKPSLAHH